MDEAAMCKAEVWRLVAEFQNNGNTDNEFSYDIKAGISKKSGGRETKSEYKSDTKETEYGFELSTTQGTELAKTQFKARFGQKFGQSTTTGVERETSNEDLFSDEHQMSQKVVVGPKKSLLFIRK